MNGDQLPVCYGNEELVDALANLCWIFTNDGNSEEKLICVSYLGFTVTVAPSDRDLMYVTSKHTLEDLPTLPLRKAFIKLIAEHAGKEWEIKVDLENPKISKEEYDGRQEK